MRYRVYDTLNKICSAWIINPVDVDDVIKFGEAKGYDFVGMADGKYFFKKGVFEMVVQKN